MDTTLPEEESPAAGVEANPQPAAEVPTKPKQECGMPLPVRGASAACIACDDCLASAVDQVSNQAITDSIKIAGANIKAAMSKPQPHRARPSGKLKHWGEVFEICTSPESNLGKAADEYKGIKVFRVTRESNFGDPEVVAALKEQIRARPGCSLHGSLPCTVWSTWQNMAIARYGKKYQLKLDVCRAESILL